MLIKEEGPNSAGNKIYTFSGQYTLEVPQRYKVQSMIGRGAYGIVCSAVNVENGELLAVKKVTKLFEDAVDCKRVLREVKTLGFLNHPNVLGLRDVFFSGSADSFSELYIATELMETDMQALLRSPTVRLRAGHCQYFTLQLLCALEYIHSAHILHRDLKPANLLTDADCNLKLCDFGLARGYYGGAAASTASAGESGGSARAAGESANGSTVAGAAKEMTHYVVTRWYRPPELLLVCAQYDYAVDLWGAGCLAAEMITGKPLLAGHDYIHQLNLVVELLGTPDVHRDLPGSTSAEALSYLQSLPPQPRRPLAAFCPALHERFHDQSFFDSFDDEAGDAARPPPHTAEERYATFESFLFGLLAYSPAARLTAREAVAHPWLEDVRGGQTEVEGCEAPSCFSWALDDVPLTLAQLRPKIVEEVNEFHAARPGSR